VGYNFKKYDQARHIGSALISEKLSSAGETWLSPSWQFHSGGPEMFVKH